MHASLTTRIAAAAFGGLVLLGTVNAAPASAKAGDSIITGRCTKGATTKLKVAFRDGHFETEFEVDSNRNGQRWSVHLRDNGVLVNNVTATTVAPSGSFTSKKAIANQVGADRITASATYAPTGERCTLTINR